MTPLWKKSGAAPTRHPDPDAAIAAYLEELRQAEVAGAPTPAAALNGLGDAHLDKGDILSAVDYYRQAAEVYEREGMHDNAIACCKKIRRYAPQDGNVGLMLGRYYAAKGLRADAVAELETYADRQARAGRRRESIDALREVARLAPERAGRREQMARLLAEEGRRDEAVAEYRVLLEAYRVGGDEAAVGRVREALAVLDAAEPRLSTAPARPAPAAAVHRPLELDIERHVYEERAPADAPPASAQAPAAAESHASAGQVEPAARDLRDAARGFHEAGRWQDAAGAYRRRSQLDRATPEEFAAWAECARQTGEASRVLEALAVAARWHLAHDDRQAARRAAEEMLLVDPDSAVAAEILERAGTSLPRG